nr:U-box domain-containing protein 2 isoform X2 [Ipomoea batatas]
MTSMTTSSSSSSPSSSDYVNSDGDSETTTSSPLPSSSGSSSVVAQTLRLVQSDDPDAKVRAAREIRRLTKTSQRYRRLFCNAVAPLVDMLRSSAVESNQAALLALLNLAVKDDANKASIISAGALEPIIAFLQSENVIVQEDATAALLTLSASSVTKPIVSASAVIIPLLVGVLRHGSPQAKVDAAMTLYNLSTYRTNLIPILQTKPIPDILNLLKSCKKTSKTTEKCAALIESLVGYEEGRAALTAEEDGVLSVVEVLECGSLKSREHAVGALLAMCQGDRFKYREPILREGAIPGVMQLTIQGTPKGKAKANTLLRLLRDSACPRPNELQADTLQNIVSNLILEMDAEEQPGKANEKLADMVQVSMEESLKNLQQAKGSGMLSC